MAQPVTRPHVPAVLRTVPRVLSIAGSDPSGGAGIQADLKSIAANGGYGMAAITALTAQNTMSVRAVHIPPAEFLAAQLDAVAEDVSIDAVKIGMLANAEVIATVARWLEARRPPVVVLDPVMVSSSGSRLLAPDAEDALRSLVPLADVVTPNLPELGVLLGEPEAADWEAALAQGKRLAADTGTRVLVKGGHLAGTECPDALVEADGAVVDYPGSRVRTRNTHGTGCSTSSALATVQARVGNWQQSVAQVKSWLHAAVLHADALEVGSGHGPINHFHELWSAAPPRDNGFSKALWAESAPLRQQILDLPFVRELGEGTLAEESFAYYLAQDAIYLNAYSRVLARASALAPSEDEQLFWASGAQNCLAVEAQLHRDWLGPDRTETRTGPVTKAYVDHLLAVSASGSYAELVAAVLPCYWIYAEVGEVLHAGFLQREDRQDHPYARWLATYADEAFAAATRTAIAWLDGAARSSTAAQRERMRAAFLASAGYERDFFDAPLLHGAG